MELDRILDRVVCCWLLVHIRFRWSPKHMDCWNDCNSGSMMVLAAIVELPVDRTSIGPVCFPFGSNCLGAIAARLVWMKAYAGVSVRNEHLCLSYLATPRACEKHLGWTMMMHHKQCRTN